MTGKKFTLGCYCSSPGWGGLEMNTLRFLGWMKEREWPVVLYAYPGSPLFQHGVEQGLTVKPLKSRFKYGDIRNAWKLVQYILEDDVKILIIQQSPDIFLSVLAKRMSWGGIKLFYSQNMHIGGDKKDFFHRWEYKHFDAWITPLNWLAERVVEKTDIPRRRIHIIPYGIELERFTENRPDKISSRKKLELPDDAVLAGMVGRIDPKKGQDTAIEALAELHRTGHKIHLAIIGDMTIGQHEEYRRKLNDLISEHQLKDYVHFRPGQAEVQNAYAALDMFILASHSETYGMVTIEAMASGLPVIGTAAGGTLDIIQPEENGLLFEPQDGHGLAEQLTKLLENQSLAEKLAAGGEKSAREKFSHVVQCQMWEELLERKKSR